MSLKLFFNQFDLITTAPNGVARLREMILYLAVRGQLVEQRETEESARKLLEKIRAKKKRISGEKGKAKLFDEVSSIDEIDAPFAIPENWVWTTLGNVSDMCLGKMLDKQKNKGEFFPYLRNINVRWFDFDLSDVLEMKFEEREHERFGLKKGDVLICEGGEPGRAAIWDGNLPQMKFQKALHRVRPFSNLYSKYLVYLLYLDSKTGRLDNYFTGATFKHFTGKELNRYKIPLPPLEEQKRIVEKVEELMRLCNKLENLLQQRQARSSALLSSLAAHAV